MQSSDATEGKPALKGQMFLYRQPEFLDSRQHEGLGWCQPANPYAFAARVTSIPLVAVEMPSAQKFFPVVFSSLEKPVPLAVMGLGQSGNLFVQADGHWEEGAYIPSYLRRYPFAVAVSDNEQLVIVIDRASNAISESPEVPFFNGDTLSDQTRAMVDFCGRYQAEQGRTDEFTERLVALDLLSEQEVKHPGEGNKATLLRYVGINVEKLNSLSATEMESLYKEGFLAKIYAHLFSLENWSRLLSKAASRGPTDT